MVIEPKVGQTWEVSAHATDPSIHHKLPFVFNVLSVDQATSRCVIATPGLGTTEVVTFDFLHQWGTLVQENSTTLEVKDFDTNNELQQRVEDMIQRRIYLAKGDL